MRRVGDRDREATITETRIVGEDVDVHQGVHHRRCCVRVGVGHVVDRIDHTGDGHRDLRRRHLIVRVTNRVAERVGTAEVGVGRVLDGVASHHRASVRRIGGGEGQRQVVEPAVVVHDIDHDHRVFERRRRVGVRHGRVVDLIDHDRHVRGIGQRTIGHRVVVPSRTDKAGGRGERHVVTAEADRAIAGAGHAGDRQHVTVGIRVVGQERRDGGNHRLVLERRHGVVAGNRGLIGHRIVVADRDLLTAGRTQLVGTRVHDADVDVLHALGSRVLLGRHHEHGAADAGLDLDRPLACAGEVDDRNRVVRTAGGRTREGESRLQGIAGADRVGRVRAHAPTDAQGLEGLVLLADLAVAADALDADVALGERRRIGRRIHARVDRGVDPRVRVVGRIGLGAVHHDGGRVAFGAAAGVIVVSDGASAHGPHEQGGREDQVTKLRAGLLHRLLRCECGHPVFRMGGRNGHRTVGTTTSDSIINNEKQS